MPRRPPDLDPIPASFAQERLWLLDRLQPGDPAYNIPTALRILGDLSPALLEAVFGEVVRRHEALRTTFEERDGRPVQVIAPPGVWTLPLIDLAGLPGEVRLAEAGRLAAAGGGPPLRPRGRDLCCALRCCASERPTTACSWPCTTSSPTAGPWGCSSASSRLFTAPPSSESLRLCRTCPSSTPTLRSGSAAGWLGASWNGSSPTGGSSSLGLPESLELPTDRPRPAVTAHHGDRVLSVLDAGFARELASFARRQDLTPFMALLAAFQTLLGRLAGREDVPLGTPIANRNRAEIEPLIGFFVNTLVLRGDLAGDPPFRELLDRVRRTTLDAYAHQDLPFEMLVEELRPRRHLPMNPLFQVMFALQNTPRESWGPPRPLLRSPGGSRPPWRSSIWI